MYFIVSLLANIMLYESDIADEKIKKKKEKIRVVVENNRKENFINSQHEPEIMRNFKVEICERKSPRDSLI